MKKLILRKKKFAFNTPSAAQGYASQRLQLKADCFTIVPYEGGYAIETEEEVRQEVLDADSQEAASNSSWKPASYIHIPENLKKPGFRYRACNTEKTGNIDKKIAEGWEIDTELTQKMRRTPTLQDGQNLDTTMKIRELVIMRMPEELAKQRDKYYSDLSSRARNNIASKFKKDASDLNDGAGAYGESKESLQ